MKPFWFRPVTWQDALWLSLFVAVVTFHPYFMQHEIIMMETGIHLPAINALFHGLVPYRDFFYLRGPLELYVPALMMKAYGINSALLPVFYYAATVATLIFIVRVSQYLFVTRLFFWLAVTVLTARTFPRIAFYYWGGMRYAIGFLVMLALILFFKDKKRRWIYLAGFMTGLAFMTTVEAGLMALLACEAAIIFACLFNIFERRFMVAAKFIFCGGLLTVLGPWLFYLVQTGSLSPMIDSTLTVIKNLYIAFPQAPGDFPVGREWLMAFVPGNKFFKFMTPSFCYLFFGLYLLWKIRRGQLKPMDGFLAGLATYGVLLYMSSFRKVEGHHFEMALQPEKLILFFLFEFLFIEILSSHPKKVLVKTLLIIFAVASFGYAIQRFDHRFPAMKIATKKIFPKKKMKGLSFLENQEKKLVTLPRALGHITPEWQAEEIQGVTDYLTQNTHSDEAVFCFAEVGNFHFWADRPFVGRFPIATAAWLKEEWYQELKNDFISARPRYVIMTHLGHRTFPAAWYFLNPRNSKRYEEMTQLILKDYAPVRTFESVSIYQRRE